MLEYVKRLLLMQTKLAAQFDAGQTPEIRETALHAEAVQTEAFVKIGCLHEYSNLRTAQWGLSYYAARSLAEHVGIQCRFAEHCVLIAYVAEEYFRVNYTATILLLFIDIFTYRSFEFFYAHSKRLSVFRIKNLVIFHVLFYMQIAFL